MMRKRKKNVYLTLISTNTRDWSLYIVVSVFCLFVFLFFFCFNNIFCWLTFSLLFTRTAVFYLGPGPCGR